MFRAGSGRGLLGRRGRLYLDGMDAPDEAPDGTPLVDDDFLVLVNSWWEAVSFVVPEARAASREWRAELDSYDPAATAGAPARVVGDQVMVRPRASRRAGAT